MASHLRVEKQVLPALLFSIALACPSARGAITSTGDLSPSDPSTWTTLTTGRIGITSVGNLTVDAGSSLTTSLAYLGDGVGSTGTVRIDGSGSNWSNTAWQYIGNSGTGTLQIINGGSATSLFVYLGCNSGSAGTATVDGSGSSWTITTLNLAQLGNGTLNITDGGKVTCDYCYLGANSSSVAKAIIDGTSSSWILNQTLYVSGALNITNGGTATVAKAVYINPSTPGPGESLIDFGAHGGTLTTTDLYAAPSQFAGTGTINVRGFVSDIDLRFDSTHGSSQTVLINGTGQNASINLDLTGAAGPAGNLGVGYLSAGTMTIQDGATVSCATGYLGYTNGASGVATVSGSGSTWTNVGAIYVGNEGAGTLNITNGGRVNSAGGNIGSGAASTGTVTVDGPGSTWSCGGIIVGVKGSGALNISNGGLVTSSGATQVNYYPSATGGIHFGANGGTLTTKSLYALPSQVTGTGIINTQGLVSDIDLAFDTAHGLNQTLFWNNAGQQVTINLNMTGGDVGVGFLGSASLSIGGGVVVAAGNGYLGMNKNSAGNAAVAGAGSSWSTSNLYVGNAGIGTLSVTGAGSVSASTNLYVGYSGTGTLRVSGGGKLTSGAPTFASSYLGYSAGSTGTVTIDGPGSTWNSRFSLYIGNTGAGVLTIVNGGIVTWTYGNTIGSSAGAIGTVVVSGSGSSLAGAQLYLGYSGSGNMSVTDGGIVNSLSSHLAERSGSTGTANIDGSGSKWSTSGIVVGYSGIGVLNITRGGAVSSSSACYVGYNSGSTGIISVDGGSYTCIGNYIYIGYSGTGTLQIANGGKVAAPHILINGHCQLTLNVGDGSLIDCGTGTFANSGNVRLKAVPGLPAGIYTPIVAGDWTQYGTTQALGGVWNNSAHNFVVREAASGTAGQAVTINLLQTQRVAITEPTAGHRVEASFLGSTTASNVTFSGMTLSDPQLALLAEKLPVGVSILSGWNFTASGYTTGNPVFLSLEVGLGMSLANLGVWRFDGAAWTSYSATDLSYDGSYANFTVTGFSGYAVTTTATPEPGTLGVLALSTLPLMMRRRKRSALDCNGRGI